MSLPLNWPTSLDSFANPGATTERDDPGFELDLVVTRIHNLLMAMEARFGTGSANGTPTPNTVYGANSAGAASYRQVTNSDLAGSIALAKLVDVGAGNVLRSSGAGNIAGKVQPGDVANPSGASSPFPQLLYTTQLASAGGINTSTLSQAYKHLLCMFHGRSMLAAVSDTVIMRPNNDAGSNYYTERLAAAGNGAASSVEQTIPLSYAVIGHVPGQSAPSAYYQNGLVFLIPNYATTQGFRTIFSLGGLMTGTTTGNFQINIYGTTWANVSAITTMSFLAGGGNTFDVGTNVSVYGLN